MAVTAPTWTAIALAALLVCGLPSAAFAAPKSRPAPVEVPAPTPVLLPPKAITETTVAYPEDAPPHSQPVLVRVKLRVTVAGQVGKVELLTPPQAVFDDAVVRAAEKFTFSPATYGGKPVPVEITFSHTFLPPPPPPVVVDGGPPLVSVLRGKLVEKGTRVPVLGATVSVLVDGRHYDAQADMRGRFRVPIPAGKARISVHAPGYRPFLQVEEIAAKQEVALAYYVERERYDPYEIVVFGEERREELSRVTLRGAEIKQVPGTFGDPYRVVQTLPGVTSVMSLLPFPIVRGASPGSTGILVDGTRVPLLYHLLAGPSVIHPEFIDEVQFYPGGAPVLYGGYTAGIIDGRTRRARADEKLIDLDANFLQSGGLVRWPVPFLGATLTAGGRYGYPGGLLSLATNQLSLSYWDYQFRLDGGNPRNGWTLFALGASDVLSTADPASPDPLNPNLIPALKLSFHRLDLRAQHGSGKFDATYRVVSGIDQTMQGTSGDIQTLILEPQARFRWRWPDLLDITAGVEGSLHSFDQTIATTATSGPGGGVSLGSFTGELSTQYVGSALTEALWRPTRDWLIRPGVRVDVRHDATATQTGVDPRISARFRLYEPTLPSGVTATDAQSLWIKAGVGVYHEPPRFFLPLPGLDTMALKYGLLRSIQSSVGVEIPVADGFTANFEAYYNDMDPVVFDLSTNAQSLTKSAALASPALTTTVTDTAAQQFIDRLFVPQLGRSFGLETMIRRQVKNGLYGWLSYTLSLSERQKDGVWVPYDYDRTHLLNVVAGLPLPRNWDLGLRVSYQSGQPTTTTYGYNTARKDGYFRLDLRVDKRAVWNKWLLDFYVDLTNATLYPEEVVAGSFIRYILPTAGLRARW